MHNYEITYLTVEEDKDKIVSTLISEHEGEITSEEYLGKKRLAYKIKKQEFANYYTIRFRVAGKNVITINNLLQTNENILRHLIVGKKVISSLTPVKESKKESKDEVAPKVEEIKVEPPKKEEITAVKLETEKKIEKVTPKKAPVAKKTAKVEEKPKKSDKVIAKAPTKAKKDDATEAKERMAALEEKLDEILKD